MTSLYPCNPHYTSRFPEGESLEATGLKMLLTSLTVKPDTAEPKLCTKMHLSSCQSICLSAGSPSYASPYQAKLSQQEL